MAEVCSGAALDRERRLWDAYRAADRERLESLIDVGATDAGAGGLLDREAVIAAVAQMRIESYAISEMRMLRLGDVEVVTYRCRVEGTYKDQPFAYQDALSTSVWAHRAGRWVLVHRHESRG